jgi:hypothetical protein
MPPVKNVGKPCAGEPHARFDGRGLETEAIPAMVEAKAARGETPAGALRPTAEPLATAPAPDPPSSGFGVSGVSALVEAVTAALFGVCEHI